MSIIYVSFEMLSGSQLKRIRFTGSWDLCLKETSDELGLQQYCSRYGLREGDFLPGAGIRREIIQKKPRPGVAFCRSK